MRFAAALAALAALWPSVVVAAPFLPAVIGVAIYGIGSVICHQIAERSFQLAGSQLPVCARCLGIYAGGAAGTVLWLARHLTQSRRLLSPTDSQPRHGRPRDVGVLIVAAAPIAITLGLEGSGLLPLSNWVRAVSGIPFGAGVSLVVMGAVATIHYGECPPHRPAASGPAATRI
jgi:uncharacterized membrane protein